MPGDEAVQEFPLRLAHEITVKSSPYLSQGDMRREREGISCARPSCAVDHEADWRVAPCSSRRPFRPDRQLRASVRHQVNVFVTLCR